MNLFLVNKDNDHANGLIEKLVNVKDMGIVMLTDGEMELSGSDDFKIVSLGNEVGSNIVEIDPKKSYIWMVSEGKENLGDIIAVREQLGANIGIVRYCG